MEKLGLLLLLFYTNFVSAQPSIFDCAEPFASECNPFFLAQEANVFNCWRPSHGAVSMTTEFGTNAAVFVSSHTLAPTNTKTEGIFREQEFEAGITYEFHVNVSLVAGTAGVNVWLANGIEESEDGGCQPTDDQLLDLCTNFVQVDFFPAGLGTTSVVNFTPTANFSQLWITAGSITSETTFDQCILNSILVLEVGPCPPIPLSKVNGSSSTWVYACYGDPVLFQGSTAEGSCAIDGYLVSVGEYENGEYTGPIASNVFEANSIPANIDLYSFIQQYSDWWDFKGGKTYRVKLATWTNTDGYADPLTWRATAQYIKFRASEAHVEFVTADEFTTKTSQQGYVVDVADICSSNIYVDASASSCHARYRISVRKFDIYNWEAIGEVYETGSIHSSEAPSNFNLNTIVPEFDYYDTYLVSVETAFPYDSSDPIFFRRLPISDAEIDGEFEKVIEEEIIYSPSEKENFLLSTVCSKNGDYTFFANNTECEERYRIRIEEFDPYNWTSNDNFAYDSDWSIGSVPNEIILNELYSPGLQSLKTYRLHIQVQQPYAEASYVFQIPEKFLDCIKEVEGDVKPLGRLAESNIELFPNPSLDGIATLKLDEQMATAGAQLTIYKSDGRQLRNEITTGKNQIEIDLSDQTPGLYFIQLQSRNKTTTLKFVKQ